MFNKNSPLGAVAAGGSTASFMHPKAAVFYGKKRHEVTIEVGSTVPELIRSIAMTIEGGLEPGTTADDYCLRALQSEELVTEDNIAQFLRDNENLKLVPSPAIQARSTVELLATTCDMDPDSLNDTQRMEVKKAIFSAQKLFRETAFTEEFISHDGVTPFLRTVQNVESNTLAYALVALQNLMEHDHGWEKMDAAFISHLIETLKAEALVNIVRPLTSVVVKLVCADKNNPTAPIIQCYGFETIWNAIMASDGFFGVLQDRLESKDYLLQLHSLQLINALMRYALDERKHIVVAALGPLLASIRRLMGGSQPEDLAKQLLDFQRLYIQERAMKKRATIEFENDAHSLMISELGGFKVPGVDNNDLQRRWRRIGFLTEAPKRELESHRVGLLGLEVMRDIIVNHTDVLTTLLSEQTSKPAERQCPLAQCVIQVTEILCDRWDISTGYTTSNDLQPLMLAFREVAITTIRCFYTLWHAMEASTTSDGIAKVSALVRCQVKYVLSAIKKSGATLTDEQLLQDFSHRLLVDSYMTVRERHLKEMEDDDELNGLMAVRNLRERLYQDSYEFIRNQRISRLMEGAWFPVMKERGRAKGVVRYYRLAPSRTYLHYGEFPEMGTVFPSLDELPERIDLSLTTDVATGASSPFFGAKKHAETLSLCFSLVTNNSGGGGNPAQGKQEDLVSQADFVCDTAVRFSEWVDGFLMLLDRNIATKETADYINQLTEAALRLALLDISGSRLELPRAIPDLPDLPPSAEFYYADEVEPSVEEEKPVEAVPAAPGAPPPPPSWSMTGGEDTIPEKRADTWNAMLDQIQKRKAQ